MNPIITQAPTMANPDAFDSVPELREELHRANAQIMKMAEQMHSLSCITHDISEILANLLVAHIAGKDAAVKELLDKVAARHVKVVQKPQGGLH